MKTSRFTEEQVVAILAEADRDDLSAGQAGKTIGDVLACARRASRRRAHGVSEPTFYNWRRRFRPACCRQGDGGG